MAHHVFTEDQTTMEWYIDGIPVAELKRRYEAHDALVKALVDVADWNFPSTGHFWNRSHTPISYEVIHGSNGVRDYMKKMAADALAAIPAAEVRNG